MLPSGPIATLDIAAQSPPGGFSNGQLGSTLKPAALSILGYGTECCGWASAAPHISSKQKTVRGNLERTYIRICSSWRRPNSTSVLLLRQIVQDLSALGCRHARAVRTSKPSKALISSGVA